jgi:putative FmdB family regulatory protein
MPLYEYECDVCGHRFELIQKFSDAPVEKCPKCGGTVHKLQSAPAFHLKGTGWYATDYAKKDQSSGTSDSDTRESKDAAAETKDTAAKTDKTEKSSATGESTSATPSAATPSKEKSGKDKSSKDKSTKDKSA